MFNKHKKFDARRLVGALVRNAHPSNCNLLVGDLLKRTRKPRSTKTHLKKTMAWLEAAHDAGGGNGVAGGYSVIDGWLSPYPETTGYLIPTFYDYARFSGEDVWRRRAEKMGNWEIQVQMPNGAVQAGLYSEGNKQVPAVFNTGQVILGWCRNFLETNNAIYLNAAKKAGDWLIDVQSDDGAWRFESKETETSVHAYDVRTAWSLLEIFEISDETKYRKTAENNIRWTLEQQKKNGWFENNAFFASEDGWSAPFTHTIAYVMEGLQESHRILKDDECYEAVLKTGEKLLRIFELRRFMAGDFNSKWKSSGNYSCLTGNAQIAGVWLKLFQKTDDARFLNAALKLNDYTKSTQNLTSLKNGIKGGVKGSHPINGKYTPYIFPNWAAKFFVDTLMLEEEIMGAFEKQVLGIGNGSSD